MDGQDWMGTMPGWLPVLLAPFVGSFMGVVVRRLPQGRPVVWDRSRCEACGQPIAARDLVPILSFPLLGGRCRRCRAPIAPMHLWIELAAVAVAAAAAVTDAWDGGGAARLWASCVLGWTLLALAWIDWEHFRLPDALTLPLLLAGLGATVLLQPAEVTQHAAAAALGYLSLRGIALAYRALRGREGLGGGDAKLLAAAGAWVGLEALPLVVLAAALLGLGAALALRLRGAAVTADTRLPLGPPLCAALWAAWLFPAALMELTLGG